MIKILCSLRVVRITFLQKTEASEKEGEAEAGEVGIEMESVGVDLGEEVGRNLGVE